MVRLNPASRDQSPDLSPESDDLSSYLLDPFPDFDPVREWLLEPDHTPMTSEEANVQYPDGSSPIKLEFDVTEEGFGVGNRNPDEFESRRVEFDPKVVKLEVAEEGFGKVIVSQDEFHEKVVNLVIPGDGFGEGNLNPDGLESRSIELVLKEELLKASIDEKMEKVSLVGGSDAVMESSKGDGVSEVGLDIAHGSENNETDTDESESDDSSSDGSSSSSSEEEEADDDSDIDEVIEVEDGEIRELDQEEMVFCSDEEEEVVKGPIKSKHEIEDLPPVPRVEVFLEPQHQTLPVGVISSILGNRVIVEGSVKHNPLNEGSILWITETRTPLGLVDEIFGPVKNPYYVVRYNSDEEVPAEVREGSAVSFVLEFANHILNEKTLYKKGYDASGDNDEETNDEVEFSDDEKEAEYKRSLRQAKRATDDRRHGNQEPAVDKKRIHANGAGFRKNMRPPAPRAPASMRQPLPIVPAPIQAPMVPGNPGFGSCTWSFESGHSHGSTPNTVQAMPQALQMGGHPSGPSQPFVLQQPNVVWTNGFPSQQQHMGLHGGYAMNSLPFQQMGDHTHHHQHQNQVFSSFPNGMPFQQQAVPNFGAHTNMPWLAGPPNPMVGPMSVGQIGQGSFTQAPCGCSNMHEQVVSGLCNQQSYVQLQSAIVQGAMGPPMQFNPGRSSSIRGRKPFQRGGRHPFGRGGRPPQNG